MLSKKCLKCLVYLGIFHQIESALTTSLGFYQSIWANFCSRFVLLFSQEQKLRDSLRIGSDDDLLQDKTITIVHGSNMVDIVYVNFVSGSVNIAREWTDALMCLTHNLLAINASPMAFLEKQ